MRLLCKPSQIKYLTAMNKTFYWASAHKPTPEQVHELTAQGELKVIPAEMQEKLNNTPADKWECRQLAHELLKLVYGVDENGNILYKEDNSNEQIIVQPGGSPRFQFELGNAAQIWIEYGVDIHILYAHSERVSIDEPQADGSVKKISIFKHVKFI
jgi:hypothetical protein